jgi:NADH:flavin oxidoreductase/NADH oxidase family protein
MPTLNDPIRIGDLVLPNRVLMSPLTRARATVDRVPTDLMLEYYVQRASAGLIISEATCISPHSLGYERTPGIWSAEHVAGWRRITEALNEPDPETFYVGGVKGTSTSPLCSAVLKHQFTLYLGNCNMARLLHLYKHGPSASSCLALLLIFLMAALVQTLHQLTQEGRTGNGR